MQVQSGLRAFFRLSRESRSLLPGGRRHKGWLAGPERGLSSEGEESLLKVSFLIGEVSSFQSVLLTVFISLEYTVKRLLYQNMIKI